MVYRSLVRGWVLVSGCLFITSTWAVNFQVNGNVRVLSEFQGNKELSISERLANSGHIFLRPILRPKLFLSDKFILVTEWSLLEASTLNDFPLTGGGTRPTPFLNILPIRGYPLGLLQGTGAAATVTPLRINEAYFRWDEDVLTIDMGRMTHHWGLGMVYNDAHETPWGNFKSVIDAAKVFLPLGTELEITLAYFKGLEAFFNTEDEDATHLYVHAINRQVSTQLETGIFFELAILGAQHSRGLAGNSVGVHRTGTGSYFIIDGYGTLHPINHLKLSAEFAYTDGKDPLTPIASTHWHTMTSFATLLDAELSFPMVRLGLGGGYFQGDGNGPSDGKNSSFIFSHPNTPVGLILTRTAFGTPIPTGPENAIFPYESKPGQFLSATGLVFAKPHAEFMFGGDWSLNLDIPLAWAHVRGSNFGNRQGTFMGVEFDATLKHVWDKIFETSLYTAFLVPGSFFNDVTTPISPRMGYLFGVLGSISF